MDDLLAGRRVLVIGGSSGIGEATARRATLAGAAVTIASRSADRLAAALERLPAGVASAPLDVGDADAVDAWFAAHAPW
ncbi:MAG: SDR family NAD(P)-dependent oxidoreductase, partial [Comamonadaceae bacterium]